jgi:hypothetical protein
MLGGEVKADFLVGWDFQTTSNGGTSLLAAPNTPKVITANFGSGALYLDGNQGSSNWIALTTGNELTSFGGTTINAGTGFSTSTTGAASLALLGGTGNSANGKRMVFKFDMSGYKDLVISLAAQRTDTGFNSQVWEGSTNGTNWSAIETLVGGNTAGTIRNSFANTGVLTLAPFAGVNNSSTAYVRVTFSGASSVSGNNRLDNIQFNATAVPEPTTGLLLGIGTLACAAFRRNRRVA